MLKNAIKTGAIGLALGVLASCAEVDANTSAANDACFPGAWAPFLSPGAQKYQEHERISTKSGEVHVWAFKDLKGPFAKVWMFLLEGEDCYDEALVFGSYITVNMLKDAGAPRMYNLDFYSAKLHANMGFFKEKLPYAELRKMAVTRWD